MASHAPWTGPSARSRSIPRLSSMSSLQHGVNVCWLELAANLWASPQIIRLGRAMPEPSRQQ
eukprot:8937564-Pyramimonas_sp.AAC.1